MTSLPDGTGVQDKRQFSEDDFLDAIEVGLIPAFFANLFGYSYVWTPAGALWAFAVGYQFLVGAALGFAVAAVGSAASLLTTRSRFERRHGGRVSNTVFGSMGTLLLLSGVVAAVVGWLSR